MGRWTDSVFRSRRSAPAGALTVGVLPGEGVGPEVISVALSVLSAVEAANGARFEIRTGGPIGYDAQKRTGHPLTDEVSTFCEEVFGTGGAVLAGPGGGRFVYDLRPRFDLFCKISPVRPIDALLEAGRLKRHAVAGADVLVIRQNAGGEYLGEWLETSDGREGRVCVHSYRYSERQVRRILAVAAALAAGRRRRLDGTLQGR